jgi:hypothetical protein
MLSSSAPTDRLLVFFVVLEASTAQAATEDEQDLLYLSLIQTSALPLEEVVSAFPSLAAYLDLDLDVPRSDW